ncbi:hypothetical protein DFH07DRAFT_1015862 [Mycena maculata]|uniref:NmrA-like domain-containing protein n=1 Tax=Mycena maculata TaxID=230809 RepID=A0AAD7JHR0_9AGAR|nr:hypothetical protein DFH07DRAFT_1015862 [Mycena maculata]
MQKQNILVTGATGHQGRALVRALHAQNTDSTAASGNFHIWALTRTVSAPATQRLAAAHPGFVTAIEGDLDAPETVRDIFEDVKKVGGIWGVFCVLAFPGLGANADGTGTLQALADVALEYGVSLFVFSSAERAGEYYDNHTTLDTRAKVMVERHIKALGEKARGLPWTILRPGFFMENYEGFLGSITVGVLKAGLKPTTTNRLVAVEDIGRVGAAVFSNPNKYASQILTISGEITTITQQKESYRKATGKALPAIPWLLARSLIALNAHTRELLADLERKHDARETGKCPEVQAQTAAAQEAYPEMQTFEAWVRTRGGEAAQTENWNKVSLLGLLTGRQ